MPRHKARKRFGQNFLIDEQIIHQISSLFAAPSAPDQSQRDQSQRDQSQREHALIEIGPGRGALTNALLKLDVNLTALELDRDLIPILQTRFSHHKHFTIIQGDALQTDFNEIAQGKPMRLVGNLPYNVATPLIFKLLDSIDNITDMHFMLQWEVVARLCAKPGAAHYGQLSVVVQNLCDVRALFQVPPTAFSPAPKVESGFIALTPRAKPLIAKEIHPAFNNLVKTAFAHRRKTIKNNLKGMLSDVQIEAAGIDPGARAETLSLQDYATLTTVLAG